MSQFLVSSKQIDWVAMKRVLRYLYDSQRLGILLRKAVDFGITAYYDVDWGGVIPSIRKVALAS